MVDEVLMISNPMVCKSPLPDFPLAPEYRTKSMRESTLNELNGVLNCYIVRGCEEKMNVFWHKYKSVNLETTFTPVQIHGYKKKPRIVFDDEQSATLPRRECNEVSAGRRNKSCRLQEQTSAAKAAM
jgi:hypothetical protein